MKEDTSFGAEDLLGELDIVEYDERTLDIEHSTVVDTGSDIVVTHSSFDVSN